MGEIALTASTVLTAGAGLLAEIAQAPPAVTWAMVAFSGIGLLTLATKLTHQYLMARLETERQRGELAAMKAELETLRAIRRSPSSN